MDRKRLEAFASINQKANRALYAVFIGLAIIGLRIWCLCVIQHDSRSKEAVRSRRHLVVEPAMRGTIRDRFHIILAANSIEYRVGVVWPPIQEIPRKITENGKKRFLRKEYVKALAKMIANTLDLNATRIEDIIYSHAVFSQMSPVILKTGLTEQQYYQLNMASNTWPGLVVERAPKRVYPRGRSGCHVIGYTASLNRQEFDQSLSEIRSLKAYVDGVERGEEKELPADIPSFFAAKERLMSLERKSYGLNDEIGKMGIEAAFEGQLRGLAGKKYFITNAFGESLRETVGSREAVPGKRLVLSISSELQLWCEKLLAQSEVDRSDRHEHDTDRIKQGAKNPFIRGGAIVAIDPKTAEVVACASYPRFDPNDFVRSTPALCGHTSNEKTSRWLEGDTYVQKVWDLEWPMIREEADTSSIIEKKVWMTWERFLKMVLPNDSDLIQLLPSQLSIKRLLRMQKEMEDNLLFIDLSRLIVRQEELSMALENAIGHLSIDSLQYVISAKVSFSNALRRELEIGFQNGPFSEWREVHETEFLAAKRTEEKALGKTSRPFLVYLEKECSLQFSQWWQKNGSTTLFSAFSESGESLPEWVRQGTKKTIFLISQSGLLKERREGLLLLASVLKQLTPQDGVHLFSSLKGYEELTHPLQGEYSSTIRGRSPKTAQELIRSFLSLSSQPLASFCHMQPSAPGSIFKLVVAYASLHQQLQRLHGEESNLQPNFFRITDHTFQSSGRTFIGLDNSGKPIPQLYKGGRIPRSSESNLGELDLISAIGRSSNPYFSLLAGDFLDSPSVLIETAKSFGYGEKTGIALPSESSGRLPQDLEGNKTGVYTTAIGQHTVMATPLQSAVMLSALANGGDVVIPRLIQMAIGPEVSSLQKFRDPSSNPTALLMSTIGIDIPIWLSHGGETSKHHIHVTTRRVKRRLSISKKEQRLLFEGMSASIERTMRDHHLQYLFSHRPGLLQSLSDMRGQMISKSSTAQSYERLGVGIGQKPCMYNHTWLGSLFFPKECKNVCPFENVQSELVVVVFLRYGTYGKDAAPLAASVAKEWREIRKRHGV